MEIKKMKVSEILEGLENGSIIRERFQRTPSHTEAFGSNIINSILNKKDIGIITLSYIDKDKKVLSILDGSSRLADIEKYYNNDFGYEKEVIEVFTSTSGETLEKAKKSKIKFNKLSEKEKADFLNYELNLCVHNYVNIAERLDAFIRLNTSVALSTIQKSKGLSSDLLEGINESLSNCEIIKKIFTSRAIQKDEIFTIAVNLLANIGDCYSGTQAKMLKDVKELTFEDVDIERVYNIIQLIDNAYINESLTTALNKYNLIHLIYSLYTVDINLIEYIDIDNNLIVAMDTKGANSKAKNDERIKKQNKAMKKAVEGAIAKVKSSAVAVAPAEEVKELDLNSQLV